MLKRIGTISSRVACLPLRGVNTNTELIRPFTLSALHRCDDNETRKSLRKTRPKIASSASSSTEDTDIQNSPYITEVRKQLDFTTSSDSSEMPDFPSDIEHNKQMRSQERHAIRPKVDPDQVSILLFPGQGSEYSGMATDLLQYPNVVDMFKIASRILKYDLLSMCTQPNNQSELSKTCHSHSATLVTSLAAVEMLKYHKPWAVERCIATSGYCVGEYAALVFAGSLGFEDAVRIVKKRSEIMQSISEQFPSGQMIVTLGPKSRLKLALHTAREVCRRKKSIVQGHSLDIADERPTDICDVSSFLAPELKVISGTKETLDFLQENYKEFGIIKLEYLPVGGAFNTSLMYDGKIALKEALRDIEIKKPIISVHSNVNGKRFGNAKTTVKLLSDQMTQPIRWEQTMHILYSREVGFGFPRTYAIMPGSSKLADLLKQTNAKAVGRFQEVKC